MASDSLVQAGGFSEDEQRGLYRAIYSRRDIRTFKSDPVPLDAVSYTHLRAHET